MAIQFMSDDKDAMKPIADFLEPIKLRLNSLEHENRMILDELGWYKKHSAELATRVDALEHPDLSVPLRNFQILRESLKDE